MLCPQKEKKNQLLMLLFDIQHNALSYNLEVNKEIYNRREE